MTDNHTFNQKRYTRSRIVGMQGEIVEQSHEPLSPEEPSQPSMLHAEQGNIAYELLLLQQRLAAYEQLHIEEMAELRQEIERLRRAFLQETNSQLRALSPVRSIQAKETE